MTDFIRVQPSRDRLRDFARWATGFEMKMRTAGLHTFAVPPAAFTEAPEELLIGALVDGHRYRSPVEDAEKGRPAPGTTMPPVVVGEAGPETVLPLEESEPLPGEDDDQEHADAEGDQEHADGGLFACDVCGRDFSTDRGRDTHRRQAHREG